MDLTFKLLTFSYISHIFHSHDQIFHAKIVQMTLIPQGCEDHKKSYMGTNDRLKTKPPLPPKPQINCGTQLVSPPSRTNSTTDARYRPIPKPRLRKPGNSLNKADNADQASLRSTETAASGMSYFCLSVI